MESALGRPGHIPPGNGYEFSLPRKDPKVNPVIKALRTHGIDVTAMHNHTLFERPHLYFMHFWANDDAVKLATCLRALDATTL